MSEPVFVDTNVFVYWLDSRDPVKQQRASLWIAALWASRTGRISFQVLQEFFAAATNKRPQIRRQVRDEVRRLLAWRPVVIDGALLEQAWKVQDRYQFSFWDGLIVAAARASSCRWLLTEDLQAGQEIDGITVIDPFRTIPDQILS